MEPSKAGGRSRKGIAFDFCGRLAEARKKYRFVATQQELERTYLSIVDNNMKPF